MAGRLRRTDKGLLKTYWESKEDEEHEKEMTSMTRKRALDIRKENLKQHNIDSRQMTQELETLHHPASPSEQAKRRRYYTRSTSTPQLSSSSYDFNEPLNPFLTHGAASSNRLSDSSSKATDATNQDVHSKDDDRDNEADSDSSYQLSSINSADTTSKANRKKDWIFFYPLGMGRIDYPAAFRGPIVFNHIYLIERDDNYSFLHACLGHGLWRAMQVPALEKLIDDQSVTALVDFSFRSASIGYQEGRELVRQWQGDQAVGDTLWSLFMTNILDKSLPPSEKRRRLTRDGNDARPDFFSGFKSRGKMSYLMMVEIKKKAQGDTVILTDMEKLALEMKVCIDAMARGRVDIVSIKVYGYTIVGQLRQWPTKSMIGGHEIALYSMSLEAPGMYMMRELGKAYLHGIIMIRLYSQTPSTFF
ncbi:hypothetical protein EC957_003568 [Mortierella hygrophila]|uniref:Uncharacterized protein n=1 Tax=Mortierella hygrophila TaxID=979708 RepID=A0A9P6F2K2_9FUNG|nr:hypothetical protein EC957_003568 [Mortierella hygrophila]